MKKSNLKFIVTVTLVFLFLSCVFGGCAPKAEKNVPLNISVIKGPTGMGMVMLMQEEYRRNYNITLSNTPSDASAMFIAGETDIAAVPVNLAAVLYNKLEGDVCVLAVNTYGVLYLLESGENISSFADLEGKTVYMAGQGATPEYIFAYLLEKNGLTGKVNIEYRSEHSEVAALLASGEAEYALLPEPNVTAALIKNGDLRAALDMTEQWALVSDTKLVQGCIIARRSFYEANKDEVNAFLSDCALSVDFTDENNDEAAVLMETYEVIPSAAIAQKSIDNSNIVFVQGEDMYKDMLCMLTVLYEANPKSIGGKLPGDEFYVR